MEATTPAYPTRLSDAQWATLAVYFAADSPLGRPRKTNLRAVVEAILYVLRAGCPWRMLPSDFPPWQTVYGYFRRWRDNGTWQRIHRYLRQWVRLHRKRHQSTSVAIVDTQSVPLGCLTHRARGFDGGKWVKGRKRHVLVDSMGLLLAVVVTADNIADRQGLPPLLRRLQFRRGWFRRLRLIGGVLGTPAVRVGPGALRLHAGGTGAAPRPWLPSGSPALGGGAHLSLDLPVPAARAGL